MNYGYNWAIEGSRDSQGCQRGAQEAMTVVTSQLANQPHHCILSQNIYIFLAIGMWNLYVSIIEYKILHSAHNLGSCLDNDIVRYIHRRSLNNIS